MRKMLAATFVIFGLGFASSAFADVRTPHFAGGTIGNGPKGFVPGTYQPPTKPWAFRAVIKKAAKRAAVAAAAATGAVVGGTAATAIVTVVTIGGLTWLAYDIVTAE